MSIPRIAAFIVFVFTGILTTVGCEHKPAPTLSSAPGATTEPKAASPAAAGDAHASPGTSSNQPETTAASESGGRVMEKLEITSPAFTHEGEIPRAFTCDGADISLPLNWTPGPTGTVCYALIMEDPDAPRGAWVHWVAWNINGTSVPQAVEPKGLFSGGFQGTNSWQRLGYAGPCPPSGTHRYFLRIYALDQRLGLPTSSTKDDLIKVINGHVLAQGELMGKYTRKN